MIIQLRRLITAMLHKDFYIKSIDFSIQMVIKLSKLSIQLEGPAMLMLSWSVKTGTRIAGLC